MSRVYEDPKLSLEYALKWLETYIVNEQLNTLGECILRVRFTNCGAPKHQQDLDLSQYKKFTYDQMRGIK